MSRVAIIQSNYIPWKGYFDLIDLADIVVILDSVQFTKNDWRNRNKLRHLDRDIWLTIPIKTSGRLEQKIQEAEVLSTKWCRTHWLTIKQILGQRPNFGLWADEWESTFKVSSQLSRLTDINELWLNMIMCQLGSKTPLVRDMEIPHTTSSPTMRIIDICRHLGADSYVTGPAGLDYLDYDLFRRFAIKLEVVDYSKYASYAQGQGQFSHQVSIIDLLANLGTDAHKELRHQVFEVEV